MSGAAAELPRGRYGRIVAAAVTLVPVLLLWVAVLAPLHGCYVDRAAQLAQDRARLARMQAAAEALPHLRRAAKREASAADTPHLLLGGDSDAVAAAALQEKLQALAAGAGVTIASADTLPPADQGSYRRIAVRLTLTGDWPSMIGLLQAIDTAAPRLLVDDLQLQAAPSLGPAVTGIRPGGLAAGTPAATMDAAVTVFGLRADG